jgi:hypothetical protein
MIPSEFVVDGVPWIVVLSDDLDENDAGQTRKRKGMVLLAKDLSPALRDMTFWHELVHALCATRDVRFTSGSPDEIEEQVAAFLGPAFYSFFLQNVAELEWRYEALE